MMKFMQFQVTQHNLYPGQLNGREILKIAKDDKNFDFEEFILKYLT